MSDQKEIKINLEDDDDDFEEFDDEGITNLNRILVISQKWGRRCKIMVELLLKLGKRIGMMNKKMMNFLNN